MIFPYIIGIMLGAILLLLGVPGWVFILISCFSVLYSIHRLDESIDNHADSINAHTEHIDKLKSAVRILEARQGKYEFRNSPKQGEVPYERES